MVKANTKIALVTKGKSTHSIHNHAIMLLAPYCIMLATRSTSGLTPRGAQTNKTITSHSFHTYPKTGDGGELVPYNIEAIITYITTGSSTSPRVIQRLKSVS